MSPFPQTYLAYRRSPGPSPGSPLSLTRATEPFPNASSLLPRQVLLKIHAVSLNYRDVAMQNGAYPLPIKPDGIPVSDAAAEVVAVGRDVTRVEIGDRVTVIVDLKNITGKEDDGYASPGVDYDGLLREYAVFDEEVLVTLPRGLSWEEGATLACVSVTAWRALGLHLPRERGREMERVEGRRVLIQGTGGVSIFALILALAAGLEPIITSSSDTKLENLIRSFPDGAEKIKGYNYQNFSGQVAKVAELTNGKGVDIVVNNVGTASILDDLKSLVVRDGTVSLVGYLDGLKAGWNHAELAIQLIKKAANLRGIFCGSRDELQDVSDYLEEKNIRLGQLVDKVFEFGQAKEAFDYLESGRHVGKVLIRVSSD
ncbi:zinc-type alcohol dehydrogenase-like protein 1 [Triangularia setosa]|uniref:Zinc-type alcohol dehydrogenase-like protein 1 n=1 Tax=Triangularia setosa TaxID=2587417 RepID=A0AAN7A500_9PEZI|nr:zinc-type alcohol dehydrogenase-like protein 1 [Podospora setosa]